MEENRVLRGQLGRQRLEFTDAERCRLATLGIGWDGGVLRQIATVVRRTRFSDGIASLSRESGPTRGSAPVARVCSSRSAGWWVRMAEENPTWGYTRKAAHECRAFRRPLDDCPDTQGTSASIGRCPSASATIDAPSGNSSITTTASGITKDSSIELSIGARQGDTRAGSVGVRGSVAC